MKYVYSLLAYVAITAFTIEATLLMLVSCTSSSVSTTFISAVITTQINLQ